MQPGFGRDRDMMVDVTVRVATNYPKTVVWRTTKGFVQVFGSRVRGCEDDQLFGF
jgi:hypothetical protein